MVNTTWNSNQILHNFQKSLYPIATIFGFLMNDDFPMKRPIDLYLLFITDDDDDDANNDNGKEMGKREERKRERGHGGGERGRLVNIYQLLSAYC